MEFKEIFVKRMDIQENTSFFELFSNGKTLTYLHLCTQLINQLNYTKLQLEQWNYYYHLGITEHIQGGAKVTLPKKKLNISFIAQAS